MKNSDEQTSYEPSKSGAAEKSRLPEKPAPQFVLALERLRAKSLEGPMSFELVMETLGEKSHLLLTLFLCLPFLQPIPFPGLSTPIGAMMAALSYFHLRKKKPWTPNKVRYYVFSQRHMAAFLKVFSRVWYWLNKVLKPRFKWMIENPLGQIVNHLLIAINALMLALPLPIPFSNTIPAIAILLMCIAYLEEDGLLVCASYLVSGVVGLYFFGIFLSLEWGWQKFIGIQ